MGWMRLNTSLQLPIRLLSGYGSDDIAERTNSKAELVETVEIRDYPFQPLDTPDSSLPSIHAEVVRATKSDPAKLWIVIDNIVYDCTDYVWEHPGGNAVIESFRGENCSWQFWRFHDKVLMSKFGRPLRIGQTEGIANRYKERPRFVGLRKVGIDDD